MVKRVKIFGERHTSTNAVKNIIERNSRTTVFPSSAREVDSDLVENLNARQETGKLTSAEREQALDAAFETKGPRRAWKHAATRFDDAPGAFKGCHVVFCVRHPASWVVGMQRRPYHIPDGASADLAAFLDKRWHTMRRERLAGQEVSVTELYNLKMASFAALQVQLMTAGLTFTVVRQEDVATDQANVFARLRPHLDGAAHRFSPLIASTKDPKKTEAYYRDYYGNERWREDIDAASMARIRDEIAWEPLAVYGYHPD